MEIVVYYFAVTCLLLWCAFAVAMSEGEGQFFPLIVLVVGLLAYDWFVCDWSGCQWLRGNWPVLLWWLLAYLPIGCLYSIYRWYRLCLHKLARAKEEQHSNSLALAPCRPRAASHSTELTGWIVYWPLSAVWFLVGDLIENVVGRVYRYMVGIYDRIAVRVFEEK